ncbi:hypothetical protein NA57DRAFT_33865 [Rhizodiscina lignyota]|uniref:Chalcone isomerase domain-containing protein n=1 Tax=Rhizodiscina lignyota TaxID=1504668 RepID=A0A9P4IKV8_9PEZI|nr:hypothetical protein NA57DRAFT_33865 [Rhizodiscina lignyota]
MANSKSTPRDKDAGTGPQEHQGPGSISVSTSGPLKLTVAADAPKGANETFQGRPVVVAPGGEKLVAQDQQTGEELELVPTGTSSIPHFPKKIYLPSTSSNPTSSGIAGQTAQSEEYTLVGLGIRTVSFLNIQVYVVGLYVQTTSLQKLQAKLIKRVNPLASALIPGEKEQLRHSLLDPEESFKIWDELLRDTKHNDLEQDGVNMAFRIVPTRSTDFNHLRDGWIRGITTRTQDAQRQGSNEYSDDSFGAAKKELERLFTGKGKAPKGSIVILTRPADGSMGVLFQAKEDGEVMDLGAVRDERIARLVWLGYLGGKNVSSESTRKGVVEGCVELVERPVGTVETKVA